MQSAFSLKIREVLIPASDSAKNDIIRKGLGRDTRARVIYAWNNSVVERKMKRLLAVWRAEDTKTKVQGHL